MTQIIIIEDEIPARNKLKRLLAELGEPIDILAELGSVQEAVDFLRQKQPQLIISDIELLDGNAFEIYRKVKVHCPIIFTTAYDQFWMDAFEENGIAYLLKPFSKERFKKAWEKYLLFRHAGVPDHSAIDKLNDQDTIARLADLIQHKLSVNQSKKRFTIRTSHGLYFLETTHILFFQAEEGVIFAHDTAGKKHLLTDDSLKTIEQQLSPLEFFRINRSELIAKTHIEKVERYSKNSLAVKMKSYEKFLKTSQSTTAAFRSWLEK